MATQTATSELEKSNSSQLTSNNDGSQPRDTESALALEENGDVSPKSPRQIHGIKWALVVMAMLISTFIYALDNTIVAEIAPAIVNEFDSTDQLPWLSVGFVLGGTCLVLPLGKFYGLFNTKYLFISSVCVFLGASALCGGANNMAAEIVGRVLAGAGGNGMYLGTTTVFSVNTTDRERPVYIGLIGLVWGVGTVLGPIVGGSLEAATWRWAFYLNLVVGGVFAPVYLFLLPKNTPFPNKSVKQLLTGFDGVGTVLSAASLACFVIASNFGGILFDWRSGPTIALYVVSGVLCIAFLLQQHWSWLTRDRIFPLHFLLNRDAVLLMINISACNTVAYVPIYYIPLYFQFTRGDDPITSAVRLFPYIVFLVAGMMINGHALGRFGYFQPWYIGGAMIALIGGVLMSVTSSATPIANIYGFQILLGIGAGVFINAGYSVIQLIVPASELAYAIAFMMFSQLAGITFGLSISGAIFINRSLERLTVLLPTVPREQITQALSGTSGSFLSSLSPDLRDQTLTILVDGLTDTFILVYVSAAVCLVASCFFKTRKINNDIAATAGA